MSMTCSGLLETSLPNIYVVKFICLKAIKILIESIVPTALHPLGLNNTDLCWKYQLNQMNYYIAKSDKVSLNIQNEEFLISLKIREAKRKRSGDL